MFITCLFYQWSSIPPTDLNSTQRYYYTVIPVYSGHLRVGKVSSIDRCPLFTVFFKCILFVVNDVCIRRTRNRITIPFFLLSLTQVVALKHVFYTFATFYHLSKCCFFTVRLKLQSSKYYRALRQKIVS